MTDRGGVIAGSVTAAFVVMAASDAFDRRIRVVGMSVDTNDEEAPGVRYYVPAK